jgi:hypothetical protein
LQCRMGLPSAHGQPQCETGTVNNVLRAGVLGDLPARDFLVSPGFAGVVALLAAIITAGAVLYASRRARLRFEQRREQEERRQEQARDDAAKALAWERWQWVVDTAGIEPAASEGASLGLGPAVTLELLGGLLHEAERLGDETLAKAVAVYQEQLLLVLAQQAGPVSDIAKTSTPDGKRDHKPVEKPSAAPPSEPATESRGGRRRR